MRAFITKIYTPGACKEEKHKTSVFGIFLPGMHRACENFLEKYKILAPIRIKNVFPIFMTFDLVQSKNIGIQIEICEIGCTFIRPLTVQ